MIASTKAIAFAEECLKWDKVTVEGSNRGIEVFNGSADFCFFLTFSDVQRVLEQFLANRFFIQINRGTSSLFKWSVIVGLQNRIEGPKGVFDHGHGDGDDMLDAIFDACVAAAHLYPHSSPQP